MLKKFSILCVLLLLVLPSVYAKRIHPEKWYQQIWCAEHKGQTEVRLADRTRCDCLTEEYAIEFDFGSKWAEAIGQALHYANKTGKAAGIVLILESDKDEKYWERMNSVIEAYSLPIKTWVVRP